METRREFLKIAGLTAAALCPGCAGLTPRSAGGAWSERQLEIMGTAASRDGAIGWAAWHGGREEASWHSELGGPALSITKSIAALAATRAAGEGWFSTSEKVADTISEWQTDGQKSRITLLMLLQQTSGLEAGVIPLYRNHPADKGRAAITLATPDAPGSVFRYGPGHWEVLAEVMRRKLATQRESLADFMVRAVMRPVGLNARDWRSDRNGVPYFSTGTILSVIELGRLGKTLGHLLAGRNADGFSAVHFTEVTRPSAANPMFGGGLWRNSRAAGSGAIAVERSIDAPLPASVWSKACLSPRQPASLVALIGSGGKRVYLWPESDQRIARFGRSTSWNDAAFLATVAADSS